LPDRDKPADTVFYRHTPLPPPPVGSWICYPVPSTSARRRSRRGLLESQDREARPADGPFPPRHRLSLHQLLLIRGSSPLDHRGPPRPKRSSRPWLRIGSPNVNLTSPRSAGGSTRLYRPGHLAAAMMLAYA
jgi:hypothetical protein